MKRSLLHSAFWTVYSMEVILLSITWAGPSLGHMDFSKLLWVAARVAMISLPAKMLITYFILRVSIKKIVAGKISLYRIIGETLFVFLVSIFLYRAISYYIVYPHIYGYATERDPLVSIPTILIAIMDIGFITGLAVMIRFVRIQLAVRERERTLVEEKLDAELKFLRNQTNPHFLMNTLNNIYALARKKSDDTAEVVMRLSELLRFMLYESGGDFITLTDEIKVLDDYLALEMMRYNDRLTISFTKETDNDAYRITPLLLLPFLENAFKHGVSETRFESFIHIDIKAKSGYLTFRIENTKENNNGNAYKSNIGLVNVKRQLELTYKEYELDVDNGAETFSINLSVNLESHVKI